MAKPFVYNLVTYATITKRYAVVADYNSIPVRHREELTGEVEFQTDDLQELITWLKANYNEYKHLPQDALIVEKTDSKFAFMSYNYLFDLSNKAQ